MRWAIVIGADDYGTPEMELSAAADDACDFRDWVIARGGVPASNVRLLLSPPSKDPHPDEDPDRRARPATKDNIVSAINEVVVATADQKPERLYFYFAGHGITARVSNRDESAIVLPGFDEVHPDHSLAIRSIAEYFETTSFADQFLFIDACRNVPWANRELEIGRWPVPRKRDPGAPPTQQFILYATAPGHTAQEGGWLGEQEGRFTGVLLKGLSGDKNAKAWSWERNCYEVRWERLASFINGGMKAKMPAGIAEADVQAQIPQDTGTRGVANRERDPVVVSFPSGHFDLATLTVRLAVEAKRKKAQVSVLDGLGAPVASALGVTGEVQAFQLPPKTYAVQATTTTPKGLSGSAMAPIELYEDRPVTIELLPGGKRPAGPSSPPPEGTPVVERIEPDPATRDDHQQSGATISIESEDSLAVAEIVDEAGRVLAVKRTGDTVQVEPGFYYVRHIGPDATRHGEFVRLTAGESERVTLKPRLPDTLVEELASAMGGHVRDGYLTMGDDAIAWARPTTVVTAGLAKYLAGDEPAAMAAGTARAELGNGSGVAVFAVGVGRDGRADLDAVRHVKVAIWRAGEPVTGTGWQLQPSAGGVAGRVKPVDAAPHWVSFTAPDAAPMVIAVPVLPQRLATLVAQIDVDRIRLFQYHPSLAGDASAKVSRLWRIEYLQRMLLAGRIDVADRLAGDLAAAAPEDPFAGVVAGYVLLRLGLHKELGALASAIITAAPTLSDAYILRAEDEALKGHRELAEQAFINAVDCGIPAFGEGMTRLLEGLRHIRLTLPRGAVVRHVFQRHVRGSMWAAFTPRRGLERGSAVISSADLGLEA
ncbi:caspase family protein [Microbacterium sp. ZW T2_14]|uniref:caspase family protein n=1 Tax=Microbacterium sp. ZW T2_14 TaxID=3378079 RepID=UPI003853A3AD